VARHCQDKADAEKRAEKEEEKRIRKIASTMAKCIRDFWCSIEKVSQSADEFHSLCALPFPYVMVEVSTLRILGCAVQTAQPT